MADEFEKGDAVRWKKASSDDRDDPKNNMAIVEKAELCVKCRYVTTTPPGPGYGLGTQSGPIPVCESAEEWFPLAELEHLPDEGK